MQIPSGIILILLLSQSDWHLFPSGSNIIVVQELSQEDSPESDTVLTAHTLDIEVDEMANILPFPSGTKVISSSDSILYNTLFDFTSIKP